MKKRVCQILSIVLFAFGMLFIINSKADVTGAVIGIEISFATNLILGLFLIFILTPILLLLAKKSEYTLRREIHGADIEKGYGYHCTVYKGRRRTDLNTTIDNGHIYVGTHGGGMHMDPASLGKDVCKGLAKRTKKLLKGRPTRPKGAQSKNRDITDYL